MAKYSTKLLTSETTLFGILGGMTFAAKWVMSGLANIEPVSLMVMLFAVTFGWKALFPIYVYVLLEFILYGINLWSINYLYVWTMLAGAAWLFRGMKSRLGWALLSAVFGLLFGLLCTPVYIFSLGMRGAIGWWISGIPFDIIHCVSNFVVAFALFVPMRNLLERLYRGIQTRAGGSVPPPKEV